MLTDTARSPQAGAWPLEFEKITQEEGFWKDVTRRNARKTIVQLQKMFEAADISHVVENFRICAGESEGSFAGTDFGDGDFYKWMEAAMYVAVEEKGMWH